MLIAAISLDFLFFYWINLFLILFCRIKYIYKKCKINEYFIKKEMLAIKGENVINLKNVKTSDKIKNKSQQNITNPMDKPPLPKKTRT